MIYYRSIEKFIFSIKFGFYERNEFKYEEENSINSS